MIFRARRMWLLPLLIANINNQTQAFHYQDEQSCKTKYYNDNCLRVPDCDYAMKIIKRTSISSIESQNFLKTRGCGFDDRTPKVCCPEEKHTIDNRNTFGQRVNTIESSRKLSDNAELPYQDPFSLLPMDCNVQLSNRIIGGEEAALREFPWMAALEYQEVGNKQPIIACGGSLISKRYVLTAAHCIRTTSNVHLTNVRLGEYNISTERDCAYEGSGKRDCAEAVLSVPIERQIIHEDYASPELYRHDIALLRLAYDVSITRYVQPICLPIASEASEFYWSAGWGQTETKRSSDVKLKVRLPHFDFKQCAVKYMIRKIILAKGQMCAGGEAAKDTCRGDSGAPLMRPLQQIGTKNLWVIEGILSLGPYQCGVAQWPGVYTKVFDYLPWILSKLRP